MLDDRKPLLRYLLFFFFFHGLFIITLNQYQNIGFNIFLDSMTLGLQVLFYIMTWMHMDVWRHLSVLFNFPAIVYQYAVLLTVALITIHFALKQPHNNLESNLVSALFGIFLSHYAFCAMLTYVDVSAIYRFFLLILQNPFTIFVSSFYVVFYMHGYKIFGLKYNVFCSCCGFLTGFIYLLFINSGIYLMYLNGSEPNFLSALFFNLMLLSFALIVSILITKFLYKKILWA